MKLVTFLALLFISEVVSQAPPINPTGKRCPVKFDGRIPQAMTPADFDKPSSMYHNNLVHGQNQKFADMIKFPKVPPSMWDRPKNTKPVEVTINDNSFYIPSQPQYKREELLPATAYGAGQGTTTFHWSVRNDPARPLNFSHLYQGAYHEIGLQGSQFKFLTGTPFNKRVRNPRILSIAGTQFSPTIFETPFYFDMWHNFAVSLGWTTKTLTVYYSTGYSPLQKVAGPVSNDNSGGGIWHIGLFKFPTGPFKKGIDIARQGYQESKINEGLIYGGIFIEDSTNGCISTWPTQTS